MSILSGKLERIFLDAFITVILKFISALTSGYLVDWFLLSAFSLDLVFVYLITFV